MSTMDLDSKGVDGLVEKIIKELNLILDDHELIEFDIVDVESTTNKSPVLFVESSLGLESWCVKHVYNYCYNELIRDYLTNPKRRLSRLSTLNFERITTLLNPTILINPNIVSLWNKRREMMSEGFLDWGSEMKYSGLVLTWKPKCSDAFAYRRWLIEKLFNERRPSEDAIYDAHYMVELIYEEFKICQMTADKCRNNYHAWEHRSYLMERCWGLNCNFNHLRVCFSEYQFIAKWTTNHVSDYSCFYYRQVVVQNLFRIEERWDTFQRLFGTDARVNFQKFVAFHAPADSKANADAILHSHMSDNELIALVLGYTPGNCKCYSTWNHTLRKLKVLFHEMELNEDLLRFYPCHQSIWYYRRFLVNSILNTMYDYLEVENIFNGSVKSITMPASVIERKNNCKNCKTADLTDHHNKVKNQKIDWFWKCPLFMAIVRHERALIKDRRKDDLKYVDDYAHYLKLFEGLFLHFYPSTLCNSVFQLHSKHASI